MLEDDLTVIEMRSKTPRSRAVQRTFMEASELRLLRTTVMRVNQAKLADQLIRPDTGEPVKLATVGYWEQGRRPIPLWVARRVRDLAEVARRFDLKGEHE